MKRCALTRRARPALFAGLVLFLCGAVRADGPWAAKPYTEWDRIDVRRILYDSPWVRHFTRTTRALEFEVPDLGPSGMELRGYHAKESKEDGTETTEFYVRWVSSRTLRQAFARRQALLKPDRPGAAETHMPPPLDEFGIAIAGPDMSSFQDVRESKLKAKSYLAVRGDQKIAPTRVEFSRSKDDKVRGLLFHFPKENADGEPLISSHETKVWFIEYGGGFQISVSFNPQMMVDSKGLDL